MHIHFYISLTRLKKTTYSSHCLGHEALGEAFHMGEIAERVGEYCIKRSGDGGVGRVDCPGSKSWSVWKSKLMFFSMAPWKDSFTSPKPERKCLRFRDHLVK